MIVVDTSVWIASLRNGSGREAAALRDLLDRDLVAMAAPIRMEILCGSKHSDLPRMRRLLSALPCFRPNDETWDLIDTWLDATVLAGERFGAADLLIGAIAEQNGCAIWSLDRDFGRLDALDLLRLHRA
jgi:predicted nucleic acid-binding protein